MRIIKSERHKGRRLVIKITAQQPEEPFRAISYINVSLRRIRDLLLRRPDRLTVAGQGACVPDDLAVTPGRKGADVEFFRYDIPSLSPPHRQSPTGGVIRSSNRLDIEPLLDVVDLPHSHLMQHRPDLRIILEFEPISSQPIQRFTQGLDL